MKDLFRRLIRPLLERQARRLIAVKKLKVVAVGGAVGKSSTKLAIAAVLKRRYKVLVHPGNFNMDISLPLAVFNLDVPQPIINPLGWVARLWRMERMIRGHYPYEVLVLELGTDRPGEIPHFLTYLKPDVAVVTAVAPEHMEFFKDIDAVAREELSLVAGSARAVVNKDDVEERFWKQYVAGRDQVWSYGLGEECDYRFEIESMDLAKGTRGRMMDEKKAVGEPTNYGLYGRHTAKMLAAAYAVGKLMGLTEKQLEAGLADVRPMAGRMNPLPGANNSIIIDDTYNSSPEAALAGLSALLHAEVKPGGRRIAIMGSMNELGADAARYHEQVGAACAQLDMLITLGDLANQHLAAAALAAGLDPARWFATVSPYAAGRHLRAQLRPGDVVLAKGSQNRVYAEEAVKLLLADPTDAAHLVRQSPAWLARKYRQFADLPAVLPQVRPLPVARVFQQSAELSPEVKTYIRSVSQNYTEDDSTAPVCVPACIFMVARAEDYLPAWTSLNDFVSTLDWHNGFDARGWVRPQLTAELRARYGWPIVSWWLGGSATPTPDDLIAMRRSGYISTQREQIFFTAHIAGRTIAEVVQSGLPVVVSVKPKFNTNQDSHAIIITEWTADRVTVVDPDQRTDRAIYDPAYVERYINPNGAGTIILPK